MAGTQRTKEALNTLFADNVTGQISPQDLRDFLYTVMNPEFAYVGDFWKGPQEDIITTDKTGRGWMLYSQEIQDACSFGNIMGQTISGTWSTFLFSGAAASVVRLAMAMDSATASTEITLLVTGLVKNADLSDIWSVIGSPMYLGSNTAGSMTATPTTGVARCLLGYPQRESSTISGPDTDVFYFNPQWTITA